MTTFHHYQHKAADTAIYPESGQGTVLALAYVGLGLGEVGEIQGKLKKVIRDDGGHLTPEARHAILAEVGDALWYLARVCTELDADMGQVAEENLIKLALRARHGRLQGSGDDR